MKRFYELTKTVKTYITAESEEEALEKFEDERDEDCEWKVIA